MKKKISPCLAAVLMMACLWAKAGGDQAVQVNANAAVARFPVVSQPWGEALGYFFSHIDSIPGIDQKEPLVLLGTQIRYDEGRQRALEPLARALAKTQDPSAFMTMDSAARLNSVRQAWSQASGEIAPQVEQSLKTWSAGSTSPLEAKEHLRQMKEVNLYWLNYLTPNARNNFNKTFHEASYNAGWWRMKQLSDSIVSNFSSEEAAPRASVVAEKIAPAHAKRLVESLKTTKDVPQVLQEIERSADYFSDPALRKQLIEAVLKTAESNAKFRGQALMSLKNLSEGNRIPEEMQGAVIRRLALNHYADFDQRLTGMTIITSLAAAAKQENVRLTAYRVILAESQRPDIRNDKNYFNTIISLKKNLESSIVQQLPHEEVVKEYLARHFNAGVDGELLIPAIENWSGNEQRLAELEKNHPQLLQQLVIPLDAPSRN